MMLREKAHRFLVKLQHFQDEHSEWFHLCLNLANIVTFTVMGLDFARGMETGELPSLLFVPFNPPLNISGPVDFWLLFAETMAVGYMWIKAISRFPKRFASAFFGYGAYSAFKTRIFGQKEK